MNQPSSNAPSATSPEVSPAPSLVSPAEPPSQNLSLTPETPATNSPPMTSPTPPETSPETYRLLNPGGPNDLQQHLLVVYNLNDPDSAGLANYYAKVRNIPPDRVLSIACPTTEEITREQYNATIRSPILSYLTDKNLMTRQPQTIRIGGRYLELFAATHNDIWAMVLIRGVPLKIGPDPSDTDAMENEPELQSNAAAVDSELALLPVFGLPLGGYVPNPFFDDQVTGIKQVGPEQARNMILVTRLDGPTVADVHRMIDDSIDAEMHRLAGLAVVDSRGFTDVNSHYTSGDIWLRTARDSLVKDGWVVKFDDKPDVIPASDPCNQVALYLGWYAQDAVGPWVTAPDRFVPGAIAYHLHSYSASTVRSTTSNWVGPLIEHGADATMGMVYEPYLALTPHEDIFTRRLLQGAYFAEAAYASERGLSWMLTVVGDPLYRPFAVPLPTALAAAYVPHSMHDDWLLLQSVNREILADPQRNTQDYLEKMLNTPDTGPVALEGLGDLLQKLKTPDADTAALQAYAKAREADRLPIDRIRIGLKLAQVYANSGHDATAQRELDLLRAEFPDDAKRFGVPDSLVPVTGTAPAAH